MIMAATMTGLSVSKMFMAGIVPGLLLGFGMCATCYILSVKRHYPKRNTPPKWSHIWHATKEAIWALIMVGIILFGIMGGIVTPTEASIICVVYGLFVSVFIYRKMGPKEMYSCLKDTVSSASAIMALVAFANVFAFILTKEHIPSMIADAMLHLTTNKYLICLLYTSEELARYSFIYMVAFGVGLAALKHEFVNVEFLGDFLKSKNQKALDVLNLVIEVIILAMCPVSYTHLA